MSENKLELKILKDSNNIDTNLSSLSITEAKAFAIMIDAAAKIIELTPGNENLKIEIKRGSACVLIHGQELDYIDSVLDKIVTNQSTDKLVEPIRKLQNLFSANGLQYAGDLSTSNREVSIYSVLKSAKKIRTKPTPHRPAIQTSVVFITGKLIAVGGKLPNIHLETDEKKLTIACTEKNASKAKFYLYEDIKISAWVRNNGEKEKHEMCDSYSQQQYHLYNDFELFINDFSHAENEIESIKKLHFKCREFLDAKEYGNFRKFLRLFINDTIDVNTLKTILIVTQSFKEHDKIGELRKEIKELFDKKMQTYRNKTNKKEWQKNLI